MNTTVRDLLQCLAVLLAFSCPTLLYLGLIAQHLGIWSLGAGMGLAAWGLMRLTR